MSHFLHRLLRVLADGGAATAFTGPSGRTTYAEARALLLRLHHKLAGVGTGDTVAVLGSNRPETLLAQLAAHLRGASVLLVPASANAADRAAVLRAAGVTALVVEPGQAAPPGPHRMLPLAPSAPGAEDETTVDVPPSVHTVFGSGGTTGPPKLISHRGIYEGMAHIFQPDADGPWRVLVVAPLSHLTGNCAALGALLRGDTVVLHDGFDAATVLHAIATERVTHLSLTPPRLAALLDHPALPDTDLSSLRSVSLGASPLPERRLRQALEVFGPAVGQGYGLTEAPMVASITAAEYEGHPGRLGSVGRIVPGMQARVEGGHDGDGDGASCGEVLVRGLALMEGYHRQPDRTAAAFTGDGWLRTGDLGRFDADGYLYLLGRADDVVVTGEHGTKVHCAAVEDALAGHPLVRQAAVFGAEGDDGALLHAVVAAEPGLTAAAVRDHVRATLGGEHFVPAHVRLTTADLPLTAVGKVDTTALRAGFSPPAR
ncbi:class I adenylate-forming enzyme family protein [Prauserella muralis]|uniref:Fatty acid--CoA ligase n=1 Tax=Prauserella muralis TaxID=588067 RepID=A0A2V4BBA1_9PSEU|nr:AMP-binding protein [Prauserella muralis]PXY32341.1 fatty acid--CoA ligase [Prauserella muralis]TWE23977.1 acyl-CoA synthetase (AMP-forming)/AMP-acid ligase II [Prauserella muralis]